MDRQHDDAHRKSPDGWAQMDDILPEQFHAEGVALRDPERRLRLAVLEDAIRELERYRGIVGGRARREDALAWFASDDREQPFSFANVCDALGLDPDYIRRGLARWRLMQHPGAPGAVAPSLPRFVSRRVQPRPRVDRRRAA